MVTSQRPLLLIAHAGVLTSLAAPALSFASSSIRWQPSTVAQSVLLVLIPSLALLHSVLSKQTSLAWSVYWTWSLVFLGLASAYQLLTGRFPWFGSLAEADISEAQRLIILGHLTAIAAYVIVRRLAHDQPGHTISVAESSRLRSGITTALLLHIAIAGAFCAIMGPAMFTGRQAFQAGLAANQGIPAFGSMYFLSNAGAIILPAMAIYLRKSGLDISKFLILVSVILSFLATNPLIGSRFLTGSFLVAVSAALLSVNARRWLPLSVILAFVTIFPTLDLLRGDGTGATEIGITAPAETLTTFDYDSFEMMTREVSMQGELGGDVTRAELLVAPFLRWVPFLSQNVQGDASGPAVAASTGMTFTNVSMPLWAEADLFGSAGGVVIVFTLLGALLARSANTSLFGRLIETPVAALLFIILRGSLYEVLGYILLAITLAAVFARLYWKDQSAGNLKASGFMLR